MKQINSEPFRLMVENVEVGSLEEGYLPVKLVTREGSVHGRYYRVTGAKTAAIWVGGVGGGWDTPAKGLYPQLCQELTDEGIASLRVRYRFPTDLEEAVLDVLFGISYLQDEGIESIALIGHSFGGAVVIRAADQSPVVRTVVTLATQSYGAERASQLGTGCSLLLLHGTDDPVLPPTCSQWVYKIALEPKRLILYPDASHGLDEVFAEVHQVVRDWVIQELSNPLPQLR